MPGQPFIRDLNSLQIKEKEKPPQPQNRSRDAIAAVSGRARGADAGGAASGIASPLVEEQVSQRTFHPTQDIQSTDGLFTIQLDPVEKIFMTDDGGAIVEFEYGDQFNP